MWLGFSSPNPFPGNVDLGGTEKIKLQFNIVLGERNLWQGPGQWRLVKIILLNFSKFSVVNSFRWTSLIWETWCNEMLLRCFILNAVFNTGFPASVKGNLINVAFMLACLVSLCFDLIWIVVLLNKTDFFFPTNQCVLL